LGELNGRQEASWQKTIDLFAREGDSVPQQVALFPEEHLPLDVGQREIPAVGIRLSGMRLMRPRQWGACWLGCQLWEQLGLEDFWAQRLPMGRQGARWDDIVKTIAIYRLVSPGSEWRLHRHWFDHSAMADLLGGDFVLAEIHRLYECHDKLLKHKTALFDHLTERWKTLFDAKFEVLLYDLTSTYFESDPPFPEGDKRKFGYSRDKRSDCVQVVIALIVTPEGFPLAYEVLAGNTADKTTLRDFLGKIQTQYGKADRIWIMDRGIPTEEVLEEMRKNDPPVSYLVGTPKGRLTALEKDLLDCPWKNVRPNVQVKLLAKDGETYVLAQSEDRIAKERAMRRRRLRKYLKILADLSARKTPLGRDEFHQALGAAKKDAGQDARHLRVEVLVHGKGKGKKQTVTFTYSLDRKKLRVARRREGRYLLRTNLSRSDPAKLWEYYLQLTEIEQAFKELKGDLAIRPIHHQLEHRIESHIFISFLAYCLQVTLKARLKSLASGLTPRAVLEKFAAVQMLDVHLPTTDGREIVLTRYTQPEKDLLLLLQQLKITLPEQAPPKIYAP
jgi:transposase